MGKGKFIVGIIFSVISALCFAFGSLLLYYATHITKPEETVAAIVAIPFAFIFYGSQIISAVVSDVLLWINFAKGGAAKKTSAIVAIIDIILAVAAAVFVAATATLNN